MAFLFTPTFSGPQLGHKTRAGCNMLSLKQNVHWEYMINITTDWESFVYWGVHEGTWHTHSAGFALFVLCKKHLAGKQFATDTGLKQAVFFWLLTLDNDLLAHGHLCEWSQCEGLVRFVCCQYTTYASKSKHISWHQYYHVYWNSLVEMWTAALLPCHISKNWKVKTQRNNMLIWSSTLKLLMLYKCLPAILKWQAKIKC